MDLNRPREISNSLGKGTSPLASSPPAMSHALNTQFPENAHGSHIIWGLQHNSADLELILREMPEEEIIPANMGPRPRVPWGPSAVILLRGKIVSGIVRKTPLSRRPY